MASQNQNNENLIKMASEKLGVDPETLRNATQNGGENLLSKLSDEDKQKVSQVLSDKELTKKVLSTPKAQQLLKKFFGENKNGN